MTSMKVGDLIAVYGTLRMGERAESIVNKGDNYVGEDKINGAIFSLGGFPGLKVKGTGFSPALPTVAVDVFSIPSEEVATRLDHYEGYPSFYNRVQVKTEAGLTAWTYIYGSRVYPEQLIESGDWKTRVVRGLRFQMAG